MNFKEFGIWLDKLHPTSQINWRFLDDAGTMIFIQINKNGDSPKLFSQGFIDGYNDDKFNWDISSENSEYLNDFHKGLRMRSIHMISLDNDNVSFNDYMTNHNRSIEFIHKE